MAERLRVRALTAGALWPDASLFSDILDLLGQLKAERDEARDQLAYYQRRSLDNHILAHGWMVAHDSLQAGMPYKFPEPADLPEAIDRAEAAEAQVAALRKALGEIRTYSDPSQSTRAAKEPAVALANIDLITYRALSANPET